MTMAKGRCESEPMACDMAAGSKSESRHQHRHHDGTQTKDGAFDGRIFDGVTAAREAG